MKDLIESLARVWGPSGNEAAVRAQIRGLLEGHVDAMREDALGNLIVRIGPSSEAGDAAAPARRIMVAAHMDEIGVIVTHIDTKGFLRFAPLGGVPVGNLIGTRVVFEDGRVGVIGVEKREDPSRAPTLDQLYIDVGAAGREAVLQKVGDAASFRHGVDWSGERPISPNHDDRIGCAILVEALRRLEAGPNEVIGVFTVQEEVGLRGAGPGAFGLAPDLALALDVTGTGDTPEARPMEVALGAGPAIKVRDGGMIAHRGLRALLERRATEQGIAYQLEVLTGGTTDAAAIQTSRAGVPAGAISIPARYVHSPSQMVDLGDVEGALRLLVAVLEGPLDLDSPEPAPA